MAGFLNNLIPSLRNVKGLYLQNSEIAWTPISRGT